MNAYEVLNISPTATHAEIRTAYRTMARQWHPDRFAEGPERDWANDKMAEINAAYRKCLNNIGHPNPNVSEEEAILERVQQLIDNGNYTTARQLLMGMPTRHAEWNYLFGAMLMRLSETEKAMIYLSVAVHQNPTCHKYALALHEARRVKENNNAVNRIASFFRRAAHR